MKKLAVIGANEFQDPLIRRAREMGYETHVFAWAAGDVGEQSADVFHPISIVEKEAIWQACREAGVEACCSIGSDLATHTVNYVQRRLGQPCNPLFTDIAATDKYEMRRALLAAGLSCPGFLQVSGVPSPEELEGLTYPIIVKPTDRSGSRGIFRAEDYASLTAAVPRALACSFGGRAILEEFIDGPEYSCEAISFEGRHEILAFTKKHTTGAPCFIETGHEEPSDIAPALLPALCEQVRAGLDALGIAFGASHTEFRLDASGRARIIEIGARMGGDCIGSDLVLLSTGIDYTAAVIDTACGRAPDLTPKRVPCRAEIRFIFGPEDLEDYRRAERESLWRASVSTDAGRDMTPVTDSSTRHGWWITMRPEEEGGRK